mmetsp:Transcript_36571/g.67663  ORF Transcript_36571/g.67663 Transcript_36571/m.67663 type:complete len:173 (+) Transcript_36571:89-607(+)
MTLAELLAECQGVASHPGQQQRYNGHKCVRPQPTGELTSERGTMTSATMSCVGVFDVDANLQEKDSVDCYSGEMLLSESPRTVSGIDAFVCVRDSSALPSPPFGKKLPGPRPFEDGTVDVKRCARKRRIRFGSLTASGGDATRSYKMAYRIYRPELLGSTERAPIVAIHGGP